MPAKRIIVIAALVVALVAFAAGLWHLVGLRFEAGDIYPPYSTLRTDPLGAKAFYESLEQLDGISVRRNYMPQEEFLLKTPGQNNRTLLYLGLTGFTNEAAFGEKKPKGFTELLDTFVASGGRLVMTFRSYEEDFFHTGNVGKLTEKLGIVPVSDDKEEKSRGDAVATAGNESLGEKVTWNSSLHFKISSKSWRELFQRDGKPVIIERAFGEGSVVLCSDSYFVSNEAMLNQPRPALLALLVGQGNEVIFDETHLGVVQETGIATLAKNYNMGYVMVALLIVAGLLVWRGNSSFVPRDQALVARLGGAGVAGKGSWAALVNLLRCAIAPSTLVPTCLAEWAKSLGRTPSTRNKQALGQAQSMNLASGKEDPKIIYNDICTLLATSHRKGKDGIHH